MDRDAVHIIGGGLAGSEAAWQLATHQTPVILWEMRPHHQTPAHKGGGLAELVCSNSFRSDDADHNAVGLLHAELRALDSLIMEAADACRIPAGSALAVDRESFSAFVQARLEAHPRITIRRDAVTDLSCLPETAPVIIATGPLTADGLAAHIATMTGSRSLAFYDAIAPIVLRESIDMSKAWFQSRYDKGEGEDYINCPLEKEQYEAFVMGLIDAKQAILPDDDTPYFEGCLPVEVMAERGTETLRHGPMKPRGLTNAHAPQEKPWAVIQLRQDNALGTLYNIVGFQTRMKHGEQVRLLQTVPGLEQARFARLGGIHRNTFINSPRLLDETLCLKTAPRIRFAGQITGCEGYVESTTIGLLAGLMTARARTGMPFPTPPVTTATGALLHHITGGAYAQTFQPMNISFGLFAPLTPPIQGRPPKGRARKAMMTARARDDFHRWQRSMDA